MILILIITIHSTIKRQITLILSYKHNKRHNKNMNQSTEIKLGLIGFANTGKTTFVKTLMYGNSHLNNDYIPTLGVNAVSHVITYKNHKYNLNIWDCAGDERFRGLGKEYIKNASHVLIFKDNNQDNTIFESWVPEHCNYNYVDMNQTNPISNIMEIIKNNILEPISN